MKKVLEYLFGVLVGLFLGHLLAGLILSEDELQKQVAQKARCKTYEEVFSLLQSPEERLEFLQKHEKILTRCREVIKDEQDDTNF